VTAGSILTHSVERVDCVEISPEVIEASEWFSSVNRSPLNDPRTKLYIEDALAYLKLTDDRYDIIVSEPSNPWIAGIGNLYSRDFFELCKQRMTPDGMMVQWFHLYEMDDEILQIVLRTFAQSFNSVSVWQSLSADVILIGSQNSVLISDSLVAEQFKNPAVAADLRRIAVRDEATLLSLQMLTDKSVREYLDEGLLNTEDHPRLEYEAPRAFFVNRGVSELQKYDDRIKLHQSLQLLSQRTAVRSLSAEETKNIGLYHSAVNRGNSTLGYAMLTAYVQQQPKDIRMMEALADLSDRLKRVEVAMEIRKQLTNLEPNNVDNLERYAWTRYAYDRTISNGFLPASFEEPQRLMLECVRQTKDTVDRFRARMGDMYFGSQQYQKAADQYARALQIREGHEPTPHIFQDVLLLQLARSLNYLGKRDLAAGFALQATRFNPHNEGARDLLYGIMTGTK
jgi:tetratricopeptide (TPR) repeat protein